jgi:hypothetical protein
MKLEDQIGFYCGLEKPLHEACFIRIREQICEKKNAIGVHRNADIHVNEHQNVLSTKHSDGLMMSVSGAFFCRIRVVFLQNKICPS